MPSTFKALFRVSWIDTDAAQVVHFSNHFRFFEKTEEEFYRHFDFSFNDIVERGFSLPRMEHSANMESRRNSTICLRWN